jgi:hypothetical protein
MKMLTARPRAWALRPREWAFDLGRHDVRSSLPAAIQAIMQNGLLARTFEDALFPDLLYAAVADRRPWRANLGDTGTFTRPGLLSPVTTPLTVGTDPSAATYTVEQYSATMSSYANSVDTNMVQSAMTLASKFLEDVQRLGMNAGQSVNRIARDRLYRAYAGGRTWCTATASSDTTIAVADVAGFTTVLVNGVPTPVSGSNPLNVTISGVANTVTATSVTTGAGNLTLGTTRADTAGDYVVATNAPVSIRTASRNTAFDATTADVATFAMFRAAVARLRSMNVPTIQGAYAAHIDPTTEQELFADSEFRQAFQGRADSPVYRDLAIGRFGGIDWVRNNEAPTVLGGSGGNVTVHRALVIGGNSLLQAPFEDMAGLLAGTGVEEVPNIQLLGPATGVQVAVIVRPPQDRLQQVLSTTWNYIGDFTVPTDSTTGDAALYKRGVVVEHA